MFDLQNTDFIIIEAVEKGRPERLRNAIRRQRHLREIQPKKAGLLDRILTSIGSALISIGTKLQKRSVLVLTQPSSATQSDC